MSAAPRPPIFRLPIELRNIIYKYYARVDGGYTHNFATNKLVKADGQCIDFALNMTCRQIAAEMRSLNVLSLNNITFRTHHSKETDETAAHLHSSLSTVQGAKARLLDAMAPRFLTPDLSEAIAARYPRLQPLLDGWRSDPPLSLARYSMLLQDPRHSWGEAPSLWNEFVDYTLKLLSELPNFPHEPQSIWWGMWNDYDAARLINMQLPPPWAILGVEEARQLQANVASATGIHGYRHSDSARNPDKSLKYTYSAASLAIRFLESIPHTTRGHIRHVLLDEDQESIAHAPCHIQGLIPFCRSNPRMTIKRQVNLWTTCLYVDDPGFNAHYKGNKITWAIGSWLVEALRLTTLGMPRSSFQLFLDGAPLPELAHKVFVQVAANAVYHAATNILYNRGTFSRPSWAMHRMRGNYCWEDLPQIYQDLTDGKLSYLISTSHDIFSYWTPEREIEERGAVSHERWLAGWWSGMFSRFHTKAPLAPVDQLRPGSLSSFEATSFQWKEHVPDWLSLYNLPDGTENHLDGF
ncbi:unnamed protein product [Periconia digitata]|uniref:Uncharacterized protein n=1 Tax=Periconia digitata TaxID=1303443 RepID=A0A9W4UC85_9PLEO|nr:unnamed protein product [Periconia digitata]